MLVADFIRFINEHRAQYFTPGDRICVDESMSRWYGMGGDWINEGLPMYVAIDRKPENGCEIQNACCATSGVMLRLRMVKSKKEEDRLDELPHDINHGTAVLKELVGPWAESGRIVIADSYFASVEAARELFKIGLRFIGVVKTATKRFPMATLAAVQSNRGEWKGLMHRGESSDPRDPDLLAFMWTDTNRRFFIASASSLTAAAPILRTRLRQVETEDPNAPPESVVVAIEQPLASSIYYSAAAKIDQHNRTRQADLAIERKLGTDLWWKRVDLSLFSMVVVDAFYMHKHCTGSQEPPSEFFNKLAEEMIDYELSTRLQQSAAIDRHRQGDDNPFIPGTSAHRRNSFGPHLTPTRRMKDSPPGARKMTRHRQQGRCCSCKTRKTTWTCSSCRTEVFLCHTKDRLACWDRHFMEVHQ